MILWNHQSGVHDTSESRLLQAFKGGGETIKLVDVRSRPAKGARKKE
jgi:hypothetical protein